ncbi:hypothetical protein KR200_002170, partial [Drosophila serrata]
KNGMEGLITRCDRFSIEVKTMTGHLLVKLDGVKTTFAPRTGDFVYLSCDMDKEDEIVQVKTVFPLTIKTDQICAVELIYDDYILFGKNVYIMREDIPTGITLRSTDVVYADLIKCQYDTFTQRAIKLTLLEKKSKSANDACKIVSLIGETHLICSELHKTYQISQKLRNNTNDILRLMSVKALNDVVNRQLNVIEPLKPVGIPAKGEITLLFEVKTKLMGEVSEKFDLDFDTFKMRRSIAVIVCKSKEEVDQAKKRMAATNVPSAPRPRSMQEARFYANQILSSPKDAVPGQSVGLKRRFVSIRLAAYDIPDTLRQIYLTTARQSDMLKAIELQYPFVKEEMNIKNYVQNYSLFLHLEELENFVLIRTYDRQRAHFQIDGEYLSLLVTNLAERRPSLVVGDIVRANNLWVDGTETETDRSFEGIVHKVLGNRILLKFSAGFHKTYKGEEYSLSFYFSRFGLRKQHHAISKIISVIGEDFLFPTKLIQREQPQLEVRMEGSDDMYLYDSKLKWFNPSLNHIQKRTVFNILRGELQNIPYVIFGPPGTGKTMTLMEVLLQLANINPYSRILVGTPSNSSADLITKKIIESKVLPPDDFIRLVSYNQIDKELIPKELLKYCATVDIGTPGSCENGMVITESGMKMRCQMNFLTRYRVIVSTNTTLGNFMQMDFPRGHFTHVLIDEAGQCSEPETMVPISLLTGSRKQVILAGDTQQLQAIVINRYSCQTGYSKSFLERLLEQPPYRKNLQKFPKTSGYNPKCMTKLLNNYRALPTIMCTYNKLFYDNELIPMVCESNSKEIQLLEKALVVFNPINDIPRNQGAFFFGIDGTNLQCNDSPSWYNPQEAKQVYLMTIALYKVNFHEDQIGIITPYAKQVKTLKTLFMATNIVMPKIGSVEEFQGQERDIILISTVRSSQALLNADAQMSLGFVKSTKRMNVAISRARAMMIVFGNPNILALDSSWRKYITYCVHKNALFGCELPYS